MATGGPGDECNGIPMVNGEGIDYDLLSPRNQPHPCKLMSAKARIPHI